MSKPLTESVLRRLTSEALVTYLGQAETFECTIHPGCCSVSTGEPVADLNYIIAGHGALNAVQAAAKAPLSVASRTTQPALRPGWPGCVSSAASSGSGLKAPPAKAPRRHRFLLAAGQAARLLSLSATQRSSVGA
jgi:hypothetical protein